MKFLNYIIGFILFILINTFSSLYHCKYDITHNKKYSISNSLKNILKNLKEDINITAYFSKNIHPELNERISYLENFLDELKYCSRSRLKIKFIDTNNLNDLEKHNLRFEGIAAFEIDSVKDDKYESSIGYIGLVIRYLDKKETIPALLDQDKIEYNIYNKISLITNEVKKPISVLKLYKEETFNKFLSSIEELYNIEDFDNSKSDVILVIAYDQEISEEQLKKLDNQILQNKKVILIFSRYKVSIHNNNIEDINKTLISYLEKKGINIGKELIYDDQSAKLSIETSYLPLIVNYPYFIIANNFNKNLYYVKNLTNALLPFAQAIEIDNEKIKSDIILKSSENSYKYTAYDISPLEKIIPDEESIKGPFTLAAKLSGILKALDLTIISSINAIEDTSFDNNKNFVMNLLDNSVGNKEIINIRNKNVAVKSLKSLNPRSKKIIKWFIFLSIPLFIITIGLIIKLYRFKMERKKYEI